MEYSGFIKIDTWQNIIPNGDSLSFVFYKPFLIYTNNSKTIKQIDIFRDILGEYDITFIFTDSTPQIINHYQSIEEINDDLNTPTPFSFWGIADTTYITTWQSLIENGVINLTSNQIMLYLLNSSRNVVTKNLIFVNGVVGQFTKPVNMKHFFIELKDIQSLGEFNYVYIKHLNRYYYVKEITQQNDFAVLELIEDVLMSFDTLIRTQKAFVERSESNYNLDLVDELVKYDYDKQIDYGTVNDVLDLFNNTNANSQLRYVITIVSKV